MLLTCHCKHCNRAIEFDPEVQAIGTIVNCSQCNGQTELYMPANRLRGTFKQRRKRGNNLVAMTYAATILLPFVGFFAGIYLMTQKEHGHGIMNIALSIALFFVYAGLITSW